MSWPRTEFEYLFGVSGHDLWAEGAGQVTSGGLVNRLGSRSEFVGATSD